jgi:hypothetical protein
MAPGEFTAALVILVGGFFFLVPVLLVSQMTGD